MKRKLNKSRSRASIRSSSISNVQYDSGTNLPTLDILKVEIMNLRLSDEELTKHVVKIQFLDNILLTTIINPIRHRDISLDIAVVEASMSYDPSDYEKMSFFADHPLVVYTQPLLENSAQNMPGTTGSSVTCSNNDSKSFGIKLNESDIIYCCYIDILQLFTGLDKMCVKKRMQPLIRQNAIQSKSWDTLPLLTMQLYVVRHPENVAHQKLLSESNHMRITLVAAYNMTLPFSDAYTYTVATRMTTPIEAKTVNVTFNQGQKLPRRFSPLTFYPQWDVLRSKKDIFCEADEKIQFSLNDIQNNSDIDLQHYIRFPSQYATGWTSFHRSLMLNQDEWLFQQIRSYHWPIELSLYTDRVAFNFMAFLNLFRLLYAGEDSVTLAVPLQWTEAEAMYEKCGCKLLLSSNDKAPSIGVTQRSGRRTDSTVSTLNNGESGCTGADGANAFIIVEVTLGKPLRKAVSPPLITLSEINNMLDEIEEVDTKPKCVGRGHLERDWQSTVRAAATSLRKVPQYSMTDFCNFSRQLSETRTRVELFTTFWSEAALYVNNNFIVQDYLEPREKFEELLSMSHICLMRSAYTALVGKVDSHDLNSTLRAARNARHMQDIYHAIELYLQLVSENPNEADAWRELSTCMKDVDKEWATVCIDEAVLLNPRHPLTLLSKGCMVLEEDPEAAEPFFAAILALHPFWYCGWIAASAYFTGRELFHMGDKILEYIEKSKTAGLLEEVSNIRAWERELGDWWDSAPLLSGINRFYDVTDLLLRIRAINLAENCIAYSLCEYGESALYFHLLALCCRLQGRTDDALCHLQHALTTFGEVSYLRSLEAECLYKKNECSAAMSSFKKSGNCLGPYSTLLSVPYREPTRARSVLVELCRRYACAYTWFALTDYWITLATTGESGDAGRTDERSTTLKSAIACAAQALKCDRLAGRAWAILASLVKNEKRRMFYTNMTAACDYRWSVDDRTETKSSVSKGSTCYTFGATTEQCSCID